MLARGNLAGWILTILWVSGCVAFAPNPEGWHPTAEFAPLYPIVTEIAHHSALIEICWSVVKYEVNPTLYGCAIRHPNLGTCNIYLLAHPAEWQLKHELRHCKGYNHD